MGMGRGDRKRRRGVRRKKEIKHGEPGDMGVNKCQDFKLKEIIHSF